jgi:hypothetical protein
MPQEGECADSAAVSLRESPGKSRDGVTGPHVDVGLAVGTAAAADDRRSDCYCNAGADTHINPSRARASKRPSKPHLRLFTGIPQCGGELWISQGFGNAERTPPAAFVQVFAQLSVGAANLGYRRLIWLMKPDRAPRYASGPDEQVVVSVGSEQQEGPMAAFVFIHRAGPDACRPPAWPGLTAGCWP